METKQVLGLFLLNDSLKNGVMVFNATFTFQLYHGGKFFDRGNQSTVRKPPTCRKLLTNFIT